MFPVVSATLKKRRKTRCVTFVTCSCLKKNMLLRCFPHETKEGTCLSFQLRRASTLFYFAKVAVQPGVARAVAVRSTWSLRSCGSTQLCRFAPVSPLSFLASRSITQSTDNPMEKLCSALNFSRLQKKDVKQIRSWFLPPLETACRSVSPHLVLAVRSGDVSMQPVLLSLLLPVTGGFALLLAVRPNFLYCNSSQKP